MNTEDKTTILHSAHLLDIEAKSLRESNVIPGTEEWCDQASRELYDDMTTNAAHLRTIAQAKEWNEPDDHPDADTTVIVCTAAGESEGGFYDGFGWRWDSGATIQDEVTGWQDYPDPR